MQTYKREDVIWASGLFEGEGWISIQGNNPTLGMQQTDKSLLVKLQSIFGCGGLYFRPPRIYKYEIIKTRKEQWAWRVGSYQNVQAVLAAMWPWLSDRRKARAKEVLAIGRTGLARTKGIRKDASKR